MHYSMCFREYGKKDNFDRRLSILFFIQYIKKKKGIPSSYLAIILRQVL